MRWEATWNGNTIRAKNFDEARKNINVGGEIGCFVVYNRNLGKAFGVWIMVGIQWRCCAEVCVLRFDGMSGCAAPRTHLNESRQSRPWNHLSGLHNYLTLDGRMNQQSVVDIVAVSNANL